MTPNPPRPGAPLSRAAYTARHGLTWLRPRQNNKKKRNPTQAQAEKERLTARRNIETLEAWIAELRQDAPPPNPNQ